MLTLLVGLTLAACGGGGEGGSPTAVTGSPGPASPSAPVATPEASLPLGKIAFYSLRDGNGEIYLLTGKGEVNLTKNPADDANPDLSPDGTKVAFSSNRAGGHDIYVMNVDGSDLTRLTFDSAGDLSAKWSPDGKRIAFSRSGSLMVMDSDGNNLQQIMEAEPEDTAPPCKAGSFPGGWSPDGRQLTFYAASITRGIGQVCTVDLDGSNLTVVASEPQGYHVEPSWSPDGEWIAYRFIQPDGNHEVYVVHPDGTSGTDLTNNPAIDIEPDWSPDGRWIAFSSYRGNDFDLYIMKQDGTGVARVTATVGKDSEPSWGP